jgi:chorismate lyase/3-hydroxybenzoate synthase
VLELVTGGLSPAGIERHAALDVVRRDSLALITARLAEAVGLDAAALSARVAEQYASIAAMLAELDRHPIRFWNYVPGIVDPLGPEIDRYMAFNRGRYEAYAGLHGAPGGFAHAIPTASAVGITGPDLVIQCLASDRPGTPIENPRQTASWCYSRRYGPRPPCFARGTLATLAGRRVLLLGGTASIVGEESRHVGDRAAQIEEALTNMDALIAHAVGQSHAAGTAQAGPGAGRPGGLTLLTDARIYVVDPADAPLVEQALLSRAGRPVRLETVVARVCRPELTVEIEGVAEIISTTPNAQRPTPNFQLNDQRPTPNLTPNAQLPTSN